MATYILNYNPEAPIQAQEIKSGTSFGSSGQMTLVERIEQGFSIVIHDLAGDLADGLRSALRKVTSIYGTEVLTNLRLERVLLEGEREPKPINPLTYEQEQYATALGRLLR